ncbi:serine/threonine protein kinase [Lentzea sp. NBRC 105346]|uniref:serine/threonine-protein kinase n=1 Tax=Lentzea sp. NBRC 105346 TaxID=3032205 RepID=UPI002554B9C2|nr:serine/threonine-protein kinase [Lentzea sp. NBRC 105346]GLZ30280.1 serine/threonine protein kinase [Lentzea sp. NBRC 105346]
MDTGKDPYASDRLIAGRYRLRHLLGQGSMGTVWAADDEVLRRQVAVKGMLRPPGMTDADADELRERTMREARAVAALSHPNLVTLYDVVQHEDEPYVVMELVPSRSLGEFLKSHGRLTEQQAASIGDAVAAALEAAHRAGITHRDVKPGNVLIADDGRVKLTDFGIARNVAESTMTSRGITLGTPAYIAPEVASGGDVTPAADRWSLGATLWAALSGMPPYEGTNVMRTINQVVNDPVPEPVGAGALAPVISGLMQKDPTSRMPLVEVRQALHPLLPPPGKSVFGLEPPATPLPVLPRPKPVIAPETPLASDPGPLPFMLSPTTELSPTRTRAATALLVFVAFLVFLASSIGGFALTRLVAGAALLPPFTGTNTTVLPSIDPTLRLEQQTAQARTENGDQGGQFTVSVEPDWTIYVEGRKDPHLGVAYSVVHFVSPNGAYEVAVHRFPDWYTKKRDISDYLTLVKQRWPGRYFGEERAETPSLPGDQPEPALRLTYKTVEGDGSGALRRTHFSRVLPTSTDLWAIEVVVPTEQEDVGRTKLFDNIASTFSPT